MLASALMATLEGRSYSTVLFSLLHVSWDCVCPAQVRMSRCADATCYGTNENGEVGLTE